MWHKICGSGHFTNLRIAIFQVRKNLIARQVTLMDPNTSKEASSASNTPDQQQPRSNFEKILFPLRDLFPQHTQIQLGQAIKAVRLENNGTLAGLSKNEIIERSTAKLLEHKVKPSGGNASSQSKLHLAKGGHVKLKTTPSVPHFEFKQPQLEDEHNSVDILTRVELLRHKTAPSVAHFEYNEKRVRWMSDVRDVPSDTSGIVYWMSRDQRVQDNWALLYAQRLALRHNVPLHVCFCLIPKFLEATIRQFGFMLKGLQQVDQELKELDIAFHLLIGYAKEVLPRFVKDHRIGGVVTDFSPLRTPTSWVKDVARVLPSNIPFSQVDAHNVVPCWEASHKAEERAYIIRPLINRQLPVYLTEFPPVIKHPHRSKVELQLNDWQAAIDSLQVDRTVGEVDWAKPGTKAALCILEDFCKTKLKIYDTDRNNVDNSAQSELAPWIHFGQISAQRIVLIASPYRSIYGDKPLNEFIDQTTVRRELSDNECFYNNKYDSVEGTHSWARRTLALHAKDRREYLYSRDQFESAHTHDDLWNACQIQMVTEGKMHGYLRMYWAKKILEWTESPEEALAFAIYLNDKYSLDGRDPNGYVGCMWSICGLHDRAFNERPVFGQIRFQSYNGCKRKFNIPALVRKYKAKKY